MHKIIITSTKFEGSLEFEMDDQEMVRLFRNHATLDEKQQAWLSENFPITLKRLNAMLSGFRSLTGELIQTDLSFDNFWDTFDYKIGNKKRAQKLWKELSDADKLKAIQTIPAYEYYLKMKPAIEKLYPETFLSQRRFETDYKKLVR